MTGVYVLVIVLGAATVFGLWRQRTDGRMRAVAGAGAPAPQEGVSVPDLRHLETAGRPSDDSEPLLVDGEPVEGADHSVRYAPDVLGSAELGALLGEQATLLQFSSAFCSPCRATRVVLADVAAMVPGVVHIEVDAESHLELVRQLDVTRTPTVLVLDRTGRIRSRATGAPRKADVIAALGHVL
ncbi:MAG: thioredoxin family protein [Candidatus Nanopelagicales bacterium]